MCAGLRVVSSYVQVAHAMNGVAHFSEPRTKQERRERRAKLEKDREFVRAQLAELRQRVPQLQRAAVPSQGPVKQSGVSKKRPASSLADLSGDAKRQKVEAERAKRVNSIWQQCQTILKTLLKSVSLPTKLRAVHGSSELFAMYFTALQVFLFDCRKTHSLSQSQSIPLRPSARTTTT